VRSKSQYTAKLKAWGYRKNATKEDYKNLAQREERAKQTKEKLNVYFNGKIIPPQKLRKEISRQGYLTTRERYQGAQGNVPVVMLAF
jgi:hypothetical protein